VFYYKRHPVSRHGISSLEAVDTINRFRFVARNDSRNNMQSSFKRPVLLTIVCILGFIWIVFSFPSVFSPAIKKMGDWYPALFGLIVATSFISYIGLWHMKRWGVQLFLITFFVKETILLVVNDISIAGIVASILFVIPMMIFYKRMDLNL